MQLPIQKLADGVKAMAPKLQGTLEAGNEAAKAIMTTDTKEKESRPLVLIAVIAVVSVIVAAVVLWIKYKQTRGRQHRRKRHRRKTSQKKKKP